MQITLIYSIYVFKFKVHIHLSIVQVGSRKGRCAFLVTSVVVGGSLFEAFVNRAGVQSLGPETELKENIKSYKRMIYKLIIVSRNTSSIHVHVMVMLSTGKTFK